MNYEVKMSYFDEKDLYNIFLLEDELIYIDNLNKDVNALKLKNEEYKNNVSMLKKCFFDIFKSLNRDNHLKILELKSNKSSKQEILKNRELYQHIIDENERKIRTYEILQEYTYRKIIKIEENILNEFLLSSRRKIS